MGFTAEMKEMRQLRADSMSRYVDRRIDRLRDELDIYSGEKVDERTLEVRQYSKEKLQSSIVDINLI